MNGESYMNSAAALPPAAGLFQPLYAEPLPVEAYDGDIFDLPEGDDGAPPNEPPDGVACCAEEPEDDPVEKGGTVALRDYQNAAVKNVLSAFKGKPDDGIPPVSSALCVMATGTGKSVCIAELARKTNSWDRGVLLLVHRDELIRQLGRSCARVGIHALVEKAQERALPGFGMFSKTVVASVQTLRGNRLASWPRDAFDLIVTDEAHHAVGATYGAVYEHFGKAKHVGFTATADRLDGTNIGKVFESLAYEYNLQSAVQDGWLVPIEAFPITTDPAIDLRDLRITAGDFNAGDLEKAINDNIGVLVNAIVDTNALGDSRTIAFTPDVKSAHALAEALSDVGISARWVSGASPDRQEIFAGHQSGKFQVLVNCMIATEGYDDPEIACVLICRPTKSRSLYSQMVGRGTRLHTETDKQKCRVVDFAYLTEKHALVSPVDLYDHTDTPEPIVARARELVAEGTERNLDAALATATFEFEEGERVRIKRRAVQSRAKTFDPLFAFELLGVRQKSGLAWNDTKPATPKMIAYARKCGIDLPDDAPFGTTKKLLDTFAVRRQHNLATMKQVALCVRLGAEPLDARKMSFTDATAWISANKTW